MRYPLSVAECYVIGAVLGDGSIRNYPSKSYGFCLWSKDKRFILEFLCALQVIINTRQGLNTYKTKPRVYLFGEKYRVDWNGKRVLKFIIAIKAKLERTLNIIGKKRAAAFLKGLYDAEGSYWHRVNHHRITIPNTNPKIIELAKIALSELGLKSTVYVHQYYDGRRKDRYDLRVIGKYNIQKFFCWVRPFTRKIPTNSILPQLNKLKQQRYGFDFLQMSEELGERWIEV